MPGTAILLVKNSCYYIITRKNQKQKGFLEEENGEFYNSVDATAADFIWVLLLRPQFSLSSRQSLSAVPSVLQ